MPMRNFTETLFAATQSLGIILSEYTAISEAENQIIGSKSLPVQGCSINIKLVLVELYFMRLNTYF